MTCVLPAGLARAWFLLLCAAVVFAAPFPAEAQAPSAVEAAPAGGAAATPAATDAEADADDAGDSAQERAAQERRLARAQRAPAGPRFEIDLQAGDEAIQAFLLRHLELQRYRELRNLDANELGRLLVLAPANVRELLATLGHFAPKVEVLAPPGLGEAVSEDRSANGAGNAPRPLGTVIIKVEPGPVTQVVSVNVSFVGDISSRPEAAEQRAEIQREAGLIEGLPFTQADWDAAKTAALRRLVAQRYPLGKVQNSLADIDAQANQARLYIELDSGRAMRMGEVVVQGAQRYDGITAERLVRLSGIAPESDYDLGKLQDAQRRLAESGYYDSVFVYVDPTPDGSDTLPVMVQLRESKRQKVVFGVGGSTDNGARISLEHTHNSVPGLGWRALSKLQLERNDQLANTDWSSPPDDDGWRKIFGAQAARQLDSFTTTSSQRLRAGQAQVGVEFDRSFYLQYDRARVVNNVVPGALDASADAAISANYAWTRRRFDDLIFPNRGYGLAVELGAGYTLGGTRVPFGRTQARWLTYWPLGAAAAAAEPTPGQARDVNASRRTQLGRLALRVEGGAVVARDDAPIPETQLFITGGDNTVRGYGLRDIGVRRADGSIGPGRYKAVVSLEWQRPIWNADNRSNWENVIFIDGGAIANKAGDLKPVWGVGTGIRYNSPVGPLQLDLAYGLETRRLRLHLNVGFTF
ncbi:BamA/TamA family outer membrane protein [Hydrogenophaga sp.]|uniref:autotransporter assembly complex protein TamA n=1 Tax=Hydrogenophaga sp. TaxID=1904254 RepID=UPI0026071E0A|nr:BamA/TamA family outer membrane protein [Hydrogenophaga sp.]MCW5653133.1 BamA/TamA family outer membrane protein [Hydrogenophaga sp.]